MLAVSFSEMQASLRDLLKTLEDNSTQLAASAEQLTVSSEQTSQATEQVTTAIVEVVGSAETQTNNIDKNVLALNEIAHGSSIIADNSLAITDLTKATTAKAEEGGESVSKTIEHWHKTRQLKQHKRCESGLSISEEAIQKFGEILNSIREISPQI
ncbi:methyl-accepting chemotaxis protein [Metabacillus crassostreae]|nr:methyl-accepting chemotaxis protein [Metabacillus crassostreae]